MFWDANLSVSFLAAQLTSRLKTVRKPSPHSVFAMSAITNSICMSGRVVVA